VRTPPGTQLQIGDTVGMTVSGNHNHWFDAHSGLRLA
jgi:multiple sugar transport system ATP-binding protein